jgi:hypothetical protein
VMVDDKQFEKTLNESEYVIALIIDENADNFWQQTEKFSHVVESEAPAKYVVLTNENAPKSFAYYYIFETCISFFINSTAMYATRMPETSEAINHVVRTTILNLSTTVGTFDEFQNYYSQFKYTIVAPDEMAEEGRVFYIRHTFSRGPLGFCVMNKTFYESLGLNSSMLTLYRSEEGVLQQFESTDDSLNEAYENLVVPEIDDELIQRTKKLIVVPFGSFDELNLLEIGKNANKKNVYGVLSPFAEEVLGPVIRATGLNATETRFIACINARGFYTYEPLTDNFTTEGVVKFLNDIADGKINKIYASEPIPENDNSELHKLVGKTYNDFLKNDENNDFIFYIGQNDEISNFVNFSKYLKENNIKGIRTAYIFVNNNSVPSRFPPLLRLPHAEFFPAKKHNESKPYVGSNTIYSLLLFARENSNLEINLDKSMLDEELEKKNIEDNMFAAGMSENKRFQEANDDYIVMIGREMGLNGNITEIFTSLFGTGDQEQYDDDEEGEIVETPQQNETTGDNATEDKEEEYTEYEDGEYSDYYYSDSDSYDSETDDYSSESYDSEPEQEQETEQIESQEL